MKVYSHFLKMALKGVFAFVALSFASCSEDIDKSNRYTFTEETIADYLENRSDRFSSIIEIYTKADMMGVLQTYGTYTLFAPTNEAVERYLFEQDSIWNATKDTEKPKWTGITSPYLEDLTDSMCVEIAKTHLVPQKYELADIITEVLPTQNYNNRYLGLIYKSENESFQIYVNNQARIMQGDELAENGVVHVVEQVVSQSTAMICEQIESYPYFSIFSDAIKKTGYVDKMQGYKDNDYALGLEPAPSYAPNSSGYARYPHYRYYKYTAFVPTNEALAKLNITDWESLAEYAEQWYGTEDRDDYTSPKNALNQLVGYHLLDCDVPYSKLVLQNLKQNNFNSEYAFMDGHDRMDYYVTMTEKLVKVMRPVSSEDSERAKNLYLNPSRRTIPSVTGMNEHIDVLIVSSNDFVERGDEYADFDQNPLNGTIHPIDGLLIYNEDEMRGNVLNERMRFDYAALLPELMTNGVRYCSKEDAGSTVSGAGDIMIPEGYCKNLKTHNETSQIHYMTPYYWGCNYLGDEFIANGSYDFSYKLPPVPAGTYELRIGYTATTLRAITQFYVNNKITGIPVDLKIAATNARIGWVADGDTDDDGVENDKFMRNHGYMKAGESFTAYFKHTDGAGKETARSYEGAIRHIITTQYFSGNDNWLRMKKVDDSESAEGMHDYIEMVPTSIVNSYIPEDRD